MRWFIGAVALAVVCAMFGTAGALVLGGVSLKLPRAGQVVSLNGKGSGDLGSRGLSLAKALDSKPSL